MRDPAVPEPSAFLLFGTGLAGMAGLIYLRSEFWVIGTSNHGHYTTTGHLTLLTVAGPGIAHTR